MLCVPSLLQCLFGEKIKKTNFCLDFSSGSFPTTKQPTTAKNMLKHQSEHENVKPVGLLRGLEIPPVENCYYAILCSCRS